MPVTLPGRLRHLRIRSSATVTAAALAAATLPEAAITLGSGAAVAEVCAPHCDYNHYYGPYDFTYARPALFAWPRCGAGGDCAPHLAYTTGLPWPRQTTAPGRITVRLPHLSPRP
jgi:hypothetical protein